MKQNEYRRLSSTHAPFLTVATDFVQLISDSEDWLRVSRDFINSLLNVFMECWTMMFRRLKDAVGDSNAVDKKRGSAAWVSTP